MSSKSGWSVAAGGAGGPREGDAKSKGNAGRRLLKSATDEEVGIGEASSSST